MTDYDTPASFPPQRGSRREMEYYRSSDPDDEQALQLILYTDRSWKVEQNMGTYWWVDISEADALRVIETFKMVKQ